ncbi:hypothetical protein A6770_35340 [Nostoc minutum NIES-26]|uniref:ATP-binding protein n=1 Tax=Nostoc minutum NIES-26 TaxID=1844469 RepID=A0A367S230_9NOSO|nr:hypothetical protein A6770_35340 [Nostoc minutum NIES-26]
MTKIFGDFIEELLDSKEYLEIVFSPASVPLKQRWRTNGLSADFMADYFAVFFTSSDVKTEVKSAVSFIANELLENAMKFKDETSDYVISVSLKLYEDKLVLVTTNSVNFQRLRKLQTFIQQLTTCDPSELYIRQLENNANDNTHSASGLGFLTMMNDYMTKIGWKFETVQQTTEVIIVSTMVQLII